jgi:hypothetical protein
MITRKAILTCLAVPAFVLTAAGGALVSTAFAQSAAPVGRAPSNPEVALNAPQMSGSNEVPTVGDPDGSGSALVKVNPVTYDVCIAITTQNIAAFTALHIHRGAAGASGPPVVDFSPGAGPTFQKCVVSTAAITAEILANPAGFYVNVHSTEHAAGALRAQLQPRGGEMRLLDSPVRAYDSRTLDGVLAAGGR